MEQKESAVQTPEQAAEAPEAGIDFAAINAKWQAEWAKSKVFESNVDEKREKYFITFPYPYVNGAPHIGHAYSFLRTDCFARYKRMKNLNVLFPQGFHATGEPILGTLERLYKGDQNQIDTFRKYGVTDEQMKEFKDKGPQYIATYWMGRWIEDLNAVGASIDWRRKFITTPLTPTYSRFIEWQYNTLRRQGHIVQGTHPVVWCPHCQSPTGDHERYKGEGESPQEFFVLKFTLEDGRILPPATLRPETVFGVTSVFLNPDFEYFNVRVGNETWVMSKEAASKFADQKRDVKLPKVGFSARELFGKMAKNPVTGSSVPILPATFVKTGHATGVVMSVPSHAPFDWVAEADLKADKESLSKYGVDASVLSMLKPIAVIKVEGYGEHPSADIVARLKIKNQSEEAKLEEAKHEIYKKEHYSGVMLENTGKYAGMKVDACKEQLVKDLREAHTLDSFYETTGAVVCRCMTPCHVKILENQWFLQFSDPAWKEKVKECIAQMRFYPQEARAQFLYTTDWLDDKACARRSGLGTPLPWDPEWKVESLSDSVIYMAYYTISRIINERKIEARQLPDTLFDYIFLGSGDVKELKNLTGLSDKVIEEMRREFLYFYPLDFRNSGVDLVQNHLSYALFHHVAIFPKEMWPRAFSVNGYVNVEGEKMSKSRGNILPMRELIDEHGADMVRINVVCSSEGLSDADWKSDSLKSYRKAANFLFGAVDTAVGLSNLQKPPYGHAEELLESKVNEALKKADAAYSEVCFRTAGFEVVQNAVGALKDYCAHKAASGEKYNQQVFRSCLSSTVLALCPLMPHLCEEMWHKLGNKTFASVENYPAIDESKINPELAAAEAFVSTIEADIRKISEVAKLTPKKATLIVAAKWKRDALAKIAAGMADGKAFSFESSMKEMMADAELKKRADAVSSFLKSVGKDISAHKHYKPSDEKALLEQDAPAIKSKFTSIEELAVVLEEDAASDSKLGAKAPKAMPGKPAIVLE